MVYLIVLLCGIGMGYIAALCIHRPQPIGNLRIDNSDQDGTYLFLELESSSAPQLHKQKYVTFEVVAKNYVSQQ